MDWDNWVNDEKEAKQLHDAMFNAYGCADCECCGQNGCGYCAIGNVEFGHGEGDTYWGYNLIPYNSCAKMHELKSYDFPVPEFASYIITARMLMPRACNPDVYGDIVRSAAAAFVADKGSDRR